MPSSNPSETCRFAGWELRPQARQLLVRGEVARVGSRAFDVLRVLVERAGQVVSKDDLLEQAWPGLVVEENNLSVQITALRKLIGAGEIVNVSGIGYRLAAVPVPEAPAQAADPPMPRSPAGLVGRDDDVVALLGLVDAGPVVSIVGTGGVGKTTLARVVAARAGGTRRDGVHWIDLAPLRDADLFVPLVAKSLGVELQGKAHAREDLALAIDRSDALVVLDNCEHLLAEVAAFLEEFMPDAAGPGWLVTSQAPLRITGERVYRLGPLGIPPADAPLDAAMRYGAVALLCQRACAADRHFALEPALLPLAIELCRQLDGLPLAIEMAAAHVATLGLSVVHQQLGQRLHLLSRAQRVGGRHHSLRSALDWSHSLLSADEQRAFRRLEPFPGSFGVAMAAELIGDRAGAEPAAVTDPAQAVVLISRLVEKSLVQRQPGDGGRYALMDSARAYAASRLAAAGETDQLHRRHAEVVADWFDGVAVGRDRMSDAQWRDATRAERDNVRAALVWATGTAEPDLLARLVTATARIDALSHQAAELLQLEIPLDTLMQAAPARRAAACMELSWVHYADGNREVGTELARQALDDCTALDDTGGRFLALARLVRLYESRPGMMPQAESAWDELQRIDASGLPLRSRLASRILGGFFYDKAVTIEELQELELLSRRAGFDTMAETCLTRLSDRLLVQRRFEEAAAQADPGETRTPSRNRALMHINRAIALIQLGRIDEARVSALWALRVLPGATHVVIDAFAVAAARQARWTDAALMAGYGQRVREERDEQPDPAEAELIEETLALLRGALSEGRLADLMRVGAALSTQEALLLIGADDGKAPPLPRDARRAPHDPAGQGPAG